MNRAPGDHAGPPGGVAEALATRYPWLTESQRERLEVAILHELAVAIGRGDTLGTVRLLGDGSFEISRFAVEGT